MGELEIIKELKEKKFLGEKWVNKNYPFFMEKLKKWAITENLHDLSYKEIFYLYSNNTVRPKCKHNNCSNYTSFINSTKGYREYCSVKCLSNSDLVKNKRKITSNDRYGTDIPMKSDSIKKKLKNSINSKYGVDNISQLESVKEKKVNTCLDNYGVEYYSQLDEVKQRFSNNLKENNPNKFKREKLNSYLVDKLSNYSVNFISSEGSIYSCICDEGHTFKIHKNMVNDRIKMKVTLCTICNEIGGKSENEEKIYNFIRSNYKGEIIRNYRDGKEIDIYIPELKIGIEYNGLYWHSDRFKKDNYHSDKTNFFNNKGIRIIHIFEDEWILKEDIVKSMIFNLLGKSNKIYARKCEIRKISDNKLIRKFLTDNHIQGFVGSKIKLGLYYNDELVSLMTFGNLRKNLGQESRENHYELLRFCNKLNTTIVGGASKLFKYFLKNYNPEYILSYASKNYSVGNLYFKLEFNYVGDTSPNFYYLNGLERLNRFSYRKSILISEGYDSDKTAREIMLDRGYHRIYDAGSLKFEKKIKKFEKKKLIYKL